MSKIPYPERIPLARIPTPLEKLERTSAALGVEVWVKRDDLTGAELSGNKVRKLEFLFADARAQGADTVITCGGEQSNHCRATALAATRLGLRSLLLLRTPDPAHPPATTGNILLDRLAGAEILWITPDDYRRREAIFEREAARLRAAGRRPYVIPEGGSNAVGSWGYVGCCEELAADLGALPARSTTILHACGSGGTAAGMILGNRLADLTRLGARVACVNVCDDRAYFHAVIDRIVREFIARYGLCQGASADEIEIIDGYVGAGYARSRPEELATMRDLARREALIVDPVYTGKAFHALTCEVARDRGRFGERIVFLHTGGIFGLFPIAAELAPLL